MPTKSEILEVPGARLYYEVQGSGPILLTIPGGPSDAGSFAGIATFLENSYTVVRYDPRGNSRSTLDGPPEDQNIDVHGDDAAQLLAALGSGPSFVLGTSGGAQIGLNLAARYPQQVSTLVAHEPPCVKLLPDAAEQQAVLEDVLETYRTSGAGPAMQKFVQMAGLGGVPPRDEATPKPPPSPEMQEAFARMHGNLDFFFAHGARPISLYVPDVAALGSGPVRIVVGVGELSANKMAGRAAAALAQQLGISPAIFPGDHGGYRGQPEAFAETLRKALGEA